VEEVFAFFVFQTFGASCGGILGHSRSWRRPTAQFRQRSVVIWPTNKTTRKTDTNKNTTENATNATTNKTQLCKITTKITTEAQNMHVPKL